MKITKQAWSQREHRKKGLCVYCSSPAVTVRYYSGVRILKEKTLARCEKHWNTKD